MRVHWFAFSLCLAIVLPAMGTQAQTPDQRREMTTLRRSLATVSTLARKKEFKEAKEVCDAADAKLNELAKEMDLPKSDRKLKDLEEAIEKARETLEIAEAKAEGREPRIGISFTDVIAPLIQDRCASCHGGANPGGNLDLTSFANWKKGGKSGLLLVPKNPNRSLLMMRLVHANEQVRMPRNAPALDPEEIQNVAKWISQGARFDGNSEETLLAELGTQGMPPVEVIIPKPTGKETVSFTKDVAPFMANLCVGCHNANRKSGGLSLETFHDMMRGGDSGAVVLPGKRDESRLFRLTGGLELPRMPANNQVRLTRANYDNLKKWFEEGNTFDGDNPRTPLRQYAAAAATNVPDRFASMSADEYLIHRKTRTEELWKRAVPNDKAQSLESTEFLVYGNISEDRMKQVDTWAQNHLKTLRQTFGTNQGLAWKGRLTIFVFNDRFGYDEFNQVINGRRAPRELVGHSMVSANYSDAYLCLQDVGDDATTDAGGLQVSVIEHLTAAYLQREGAKVPNWAVRGAGLAMAAAEQKDNEYLNNLDAIALEAVKGVLNPADLLADGTFSPATTGAVGYTLVRYMIQQGNLSKFGQFVQALRGGESVEQAIRSVYKADVATFARGYFGALNRRR